MAFRTDRNGRHIERLPVGQSVGASIWGSCRYPHLKLCGEIRLDDRAGLARRLGITDNSVADSDVVLASYDRWRTNCVEQLAGDYAFVIADCRSGAIFGARDHFGVVPFYYRTDDTTVCFSTGLSSLLNIGEAIDPAAVQALLNTGTTTSRQTLYRDIRRLPPAHSFLIDSRREKVRRYWTLEPTHAEDRTDAEVSERLRDLLRDAVAVRLNASHQPGSLLSGGLDSSAVTGTAIVWSSETGRPLRTLSGRFKHNPRADEGAWIRISSEFFSSRCSFQSHEVEIDSLDPFEQLASITRAFGRPAVNPNSYMLWALFQKARDLGIDTLLTGHDGDNVMSHGLGGLADIASQGRWNQLHTALLELQPTFKAYRSADIALTTMYVLPVLPRLLSQGRLLTAWKGSQTLARLLGTRAPRLLFEATKAALNIPLRVKLSPPNLAGPAVHRRWWNSASRDRRAISQDWTERGLHLASLASDLMTSGFEDLHAMASASNLNVRHPLFDKRIVELCVTLPINQKIRDGKTRYLMRNALKDILPEEVLQRPDKAYLGDHIYTQISARADVIRQWCETRAQHHIWDRDQLLSILEQYKTRSSERDGNALYAFFAITAWEEAFRPSYNGVTTELV